jgi:hypothetical protein
MIERIMLLYLKFFRVSLFLEAFGIISRDVTGANAWSEIILSPHSIPSPFSPLPLPLSPLTVAYRPVPTDCLLWQASSICLRLGLSYGCMQDDVVDRCSLMLHTLETPENVKIARLVGVLRIKHYCLIVHAPHLDL